MKRIETWDLKRLALITGTPTLAKILNMSEERLNELFVDELIMEGEYNNIIQRTVIPEVNLVKRDYDWTRKPTISFREGSTQDKGQAVQVANKLINYLENLSGE